MPPDTLATVAGIRRVLLKAALFLVLVLGLLAASPSLYRQAKIHRYNSLAEKSLEKGDLQTALFYASSVRSLQPANDKATGVIARIALDQQQPSALLWLARWTELNPKDPVRMAALGKVALVRNQVAVAETCLAALKKLPGASPSDITELESSLLARTGKTEEALRLLKESSEAPGANPQFALNYAILLLTQPNAQRQQEALALLRQLSSNPTLVSAASNSLILYAFDKKDRELARQSAAVLAAKDKLSVDEYLLLMDVALFVDRKLPGDFETQIHAILRRSFRGFPRVIDWLLLHRQFDLADSLIAHYRKEGTSPTVVNPLYALRMANRGEWEKILETLQDSSWKDLGVMRYMLLIQACRVLNKHEFDGLQRRYGEALALELGRFPLAIFEADRFARQWRWKEERLAMWNAVAREGSLPAFQLKSELAGAQKQGDTLKLLGLSEILLKRFPQDKALLNNAITFRLLLEVSPALQLDKARELAEQNPGVNSFKTTYALALLKNGKPAEALAEYQAFPEAELQKPTMAAYYAMALLATGQTDKAAPYLLLAKPAPLLPEEKALLKQ